MLKTIQQTRDLAIRHIMSRVLQNDLTVDQGRALIDALILEHEVILDSIKRWERACSQVTKGWTLVIGDEGK